MVLFPHAKINIGLYITKKRKDGFHDLETCFFPVPWTDVLEITPSEGEFTFSSSGLDIAGAIEDNLCYKAYELLHKDHQMPPVHIHLHKIIPMGAGLGGGSSDAAFTLMGLRDLFQLPLTNEDLKPYAVKLGSDCAFFLSNQAAFGKGKGDQLSPIDASLKGKFLVLLYPAVGISTAQAYAGVTPAKAPVDLRKAILKTDWKETISNDFEKSIFPTHPVLASLKEEMYTLGATYAAMSGSGSTIFGIFDKKIDPPAGWADYTVWSGLVD
ncbi:4-(cytidine 5'-diphospho)-2-C-methyl-D-erythritol kinase [Aquirufa sp. KTFRIE-69F]|uniref:4-diphosphocytidyl-2-C-methyl-D-erythritol kinase n=1 Tax=Aquirufa originis TaxID=3096514 RepID=A0ABW6D626_9BACT